MLKLKCANVCKCVQVFKWKCVEKWKFEKVHMYCATVQRNGVGVQKHREQPPVDSAGHDLRVFGEFTVS